VLNVAATSSGAQAEVFVDGQSLGILSVPNTGSVSVFADTASLLTPSLAAGSHGILVRNVNGTFVLNQIKVSAMQTSSTALALSSNPSVAGQQVTFTATVAPTGVTGSVQFIDGASTLGSPVTLTNGIAAYMTSSLSVGVHNISASYSGDSNYLPSTSAVMTEVITATGAVSTTTALNATAKTFFHQPVVFSVQVTATSGTATGNIILLEGNQQLGSSLPLNGSGAATFSTPLHPSVHNIQAVYLGNNNFNGSASTAQPVTASPRPKPR